MVLCTRFHYVVHGADISVESCSILNIEHNHINILHLLWSRFLVFPYSDWIGMPVLISLPFFTVSPASAFSLNPCSGANTFFMLIFEASSVSNRCAIFCLSLMFDLPPMLPVYCSAKKQGFHLLGSVYYLLSKQSIE